MLWLPSLYLALAQAEPAGPDLAALLAKVDDNARGGSSHATVTMEVKTRRYARTLTMESWSEGTDKSLIRILSPARDAGVSTLLVGDNLWNYLPRVGRTMKVPSAMMSGSWMGSHFSNDDLVHETRLSEDFSFALAPEQPAEGHTIRCTPKPDTPVVWGHIDVTVRPDGVPLEQAFYDEGGRRVRTMAFGDIQTVGGTAMALEIRVTVADKPEEFTRVRFERLEVDVDFDDSLFTLQALTE
jgi:outer membrane lipoprotein-sorting protein